jgi:purine-binding chemotaxis protein CheW
MTPRTATPPIAAAPALLPGAPTQAPKQAPAQTPPPREFLAFKLGAEEYGVDILRVREIRSYEVPTRIAGAGDCVRGVINLRGVIVPIVDLRLQLRLAPVTADAFTVVIVLNLGHRLVGMVVDAVSDVITLAAEQWRELPDLQAAEHLLALGAVDDRLLLLLDIDKLMGNAGLGPSAAVSAAAPGSLQ